MTHPTNNVAEELAKAVERGAAVIDCPACNSPCLARYSPYFESLRCLTPDCHATGFYQLAEGN